MNENPTRVKPGTGIFYSFFFLIGMVLLLLVPILTSAGPDNQGWWTQPAFMPTVSLLLIAGTATYLCFQHIRTLRKGSTSGDSTSGDSTGSISKTEVDPSLKNELIQWLKPLEFFVYYIGYIWLLDLIGYFLSSLAFILFLAWRVGLRSPRWMLTGFLFAILLVAAFRWALGVWVPQAELYALFPKDIRIFLMNNF